MANALSQLLELFKRSCKIKIRKLITKLHIKHSKFTQNKNMFFHEQGMDFALHEKFLLLHIVQC